MKMKTFKKVVSMAIVLSMFSLIVGCNQEIKTESDGVFIYHYAGDTPNFGMDTFDDYYVIIDSVSILSETVYIPAYYKGKEVRSISWSTPTLWKPINYSLNLTGVKRVYLPFMCPAAETLPGNTYPEITFVPCVGTNYVDYVNSFLYTYIECLEQENSIVYLTKYLYEKHLTYDEYFKEEINSGSATKENVTLKIANTVFLFNYENASNMNYFFINNFEYGGKIEDTPYEPLREGYTFGGWYKEAGCTNAWDFEEDTLPVEIKDEEGETVYQETKLYAKWNKN